MSVCVCVCVQHFHHQHRGARFEIGKMNFSPLPFVYYLREWKKRYLFLSKPSYECDNKQKLPSPFVAFSSSSLTWNHVVQNGGEAATSGSQPQSSIRSIGSILCLQVIEVEKTFSPHPFWSAGTKKKFRCGGRQSASAPSWTITPTWMIAVIAQRLFLLRRDCDSSSSYNNHKEMTNVVL